MATEVVGTQSTKSGKGKRQYALGLKRHFTKKGKHPYDLIEWERRSAGISSGDGTSVFEQDNIEVPAAWSQLATNVVASKYFRGAMGSPEREYSVKQLIDRVVLTLKAWGVEEGYFATKDEAEVFEYELAHLLVHQMAAFNSPVWFNVGMRENPQCSACFILSVEDTMDSILSWIGKEGVIFKGGSGSGINLSAIRSSKER
ncbi:MAG: vitamin B12-dependent ribonucleotide reductase, partial [Thermoleophilia bacterium]